MRQSDGTDLLGTNDPRSADIGIIYVAADDSRQSVLTAILTQERYHRKQIALILPERNNALSRPVDFDGLKDMRRDLQAQLVIVAPGGSSPSELARHRRFTVYPSLETFAQSLHDEEQASGTPRKGRGIGRRPKVVDADSAASTPSNAPEEEQQPLPAVDVAPSSPPQTANTGQVQETPQPAPANADDAGDEDDREIEFPLVAPPVVEDDVTQPRNVPVQADAEPVVNDMDSESSRSSGSSTSSAAGVEEEADDEEKIILIPPPPRLNAPRNYPVPVGVTAPGFSAPVDASANYPSRYAPRRRWRWWIAIPVVLLLLIIGFFVYRPLLDLIFVPQATVTITPASKDLKQTYTLAAGLGTPGQSQVQARLLYAASGTQQTTVHAGGTARIPALPAVGTLTFYNSSPSPQTVAAGTVFVGKSGVQVVNDADVTVPANVPPIEGTTTVSAHAITGGTVGNIPALDLSNVSCCGNPGITVENITPFTGGQDAQTYTYVEQSDIDHAASTLASMLASNTQVMLLKQVQKGEQLVAPPQCTPVVTSDPFPGDRAPTVTVSAAVICTGEVYDQRSAFALAAYLLMTDPTLNPGANFMPVGHIKTTVRQATMGAKNTVTLHIFTEGIWVYQFNSAQIHSLQKLIAGKSQDDAKSLLSRQLGVNKTSIQLYGGNGMNLPSDISRIRLDILSVAGLPESAAP